MGGFGGLPATIAKMDSLGRSARSAAKDVKGLGDAIFAAIKADDDRRHRQADEANKATQDREKAKAEQARKEREVSEGYPWPVWGELLTPEQKIAAGAGVRPGAAEAGTAAALKELTERIDKFKGDNSSYWARLFEKEIPYLEKGATNSFDAQYMLSTILKWGIPGIMQELADPKTPIEARHLLEQLLQFAQSGQIKIDNLAKRFEDSNSAQQDIDKTVKRINDQQDRMNKFVEDIGKGVDRIEQKVVQGGHEEYGMQKFSDHLEQVTGGLGTSH